MSYSEDAIRDRLTNSLDRLGEAHWWIHELDQHYHRALPFRYYLNSFLRALKEVPQVLMMEMQNEPGFSDWYKDATTDTFNDPLLKYMFKQRDYVVHRAMLIPESTAMFGITEGKGLKAGIGGSVNPQLDSVDVMFRYVSVAAEKGDWFGILADDDDSIPCVERQWRLEQFPETEVTELVATAWRQAGLLVAATVEWLGGAELDLALSCRHSDYTTRFLRFDRDELNAAVESLRAGAAQEEAYKRVARSANYLRW